MGLSIHYTGQISQYSYISDLVHEVEDICKSLKWTYYTWPKNKKSKPYPHINDPDNFNYTVEDLAGIRIVPDECEPIDLVFFPSGRLCSSLKLRLSDPVKNDLMVEWVSTKTQYAGIDTHLAVVKLLRYLSEKYFSFFEMNDEGLYWETGDLALLQSQFKKYDFIVNTMRASLSDFKRRPGESEDSLADRLEAFLKGKFGGEG